MLSPADQDLVARDPGLPGLAQILDVEAMRQALAQQLALEARTLTLAKRYIRYKPGTNCLVAYRGRADGQVFECFAKAHGADAPEKLAKADHRKYRPGPLGPGHLKLAGTGVVVTFFPNDAKLRSLRKVIDPANQAALCDPTGVAPATMQLHQLAYKPERRFVARLDDGGTPRAVVKVYKSGAYAKALQRAQFAATIPFLPRLLAADASRQTLLFDWQPGRTLVEDIRGGVARLADLRATGARIAALHRVAPAADLDHQDAAGEIQGLREVMKGVRALVPAAREQARRLADAAAAALQALPRRSALIHGDFYANQVLLQDAGTSLLDCDELRIGDPAFDLGLFIAHLECEVLFGRLDAATAAAQQQAFCEGYRAAGGSYAERALGVFTVLGLLQLAHRPFRDCHPEWPQHILAWLARCEQLLAGAATAEPGERHDPGASTATTDAAMPFLDDALDATQVLGLLQQALGAHFPPAQLHACSPRLLRHKPGRRALVEYAFHDAAGHPTVTVLGKLRAKRLDERAYRVTRALHERGSRPVGRYRSAVPHPFATVPALHMWLQEKVPGQPAWNDLAADHGAQVAAAIAAALHDLHTSGITPDRRHTLDDEITILDSRLSETARSHPLWASRIGQVNARCRELADTLGARPACPVHRDFYPDQVLVSADRLSLLDFDLCCLGDPAVDVGNFVAHLQERDLRLRNDPWAGYAVQKAFLERYYALAGDPALPAAVDVYRILTLARHIHISTRFIERRAATHRLLALCEEQLLKYDSSGESDAVCR